MTVLYAYATDEGLRSSHNLVDTPVEIHTEGMLEGKFQFYLLLKRLGFASAQDRIFLSRDSNVLIVFKF